MRKALAITFSLALFLEACSGKSIASKSLTPTPNQSASSTHEPAATQPSGGLLIYYLFPGKSQASYKITIHPQAQGNVPQTVTATTDQLTGAIRMRAGDLAQATLDPISVDLTHLTTGDAQFNRVLHEQILQTDRFPKATFVPTKIEGMPDSYETGKTISLTIIGDLTIRDITRPVSVLAQVQKSGGRITGTASGTILWSDFGFAPIDIAGLFTADDIISFNLEFSAMPLVE
jgi:polyisoprenoid-binding protein YceI